MNCSRVFINARFPFRFSFLHLLLFSCVFIFISFLVCLEREREKWGGTDLRRTRADQVRLTKSRECFSVCCFEISRDVRFDSIGPFSSHLKTSPNYEFVLKQKRKKEDERPGPRMQGDPGLYNLEV